MIEPPVLPSSIPVCAIGASAGGVGALQTLFRLLPDDLGLAYVVVIHLSPDHPSALHEILGVATRMPVFQVEDGPTLRANCVYVIAPDRELVIEGDEVKSRPFTDVRGRRAPIDMFFRSVAAGRGDGIAVVLTGAGSDGAVGVRAIKEAGGLIMVQEPAEAGYPSMPQNVIATGVADVIAPLARLAERIGEAARSKDAVRSLDGDGAANDVRRIITFLRMRTGHDFSGYKRTTVLRRISRRMQVCQILNLADYAHHLRDTPEETEKLFADLLISVTTFFRDPDAFAALNSRVIQPLLESMAGGEADDDLRAWVVGCATGEEAYSLAILLLEGAEHRRLRIPIQIFATDLDEGALATAREGRYPRTIEADVSAERLRRFFVDEGTHYRISRKVRDLVLFATHSVVREPPFMRLDLVTCRNVLIYLERALQQHVCAIFHYGLKPDGYLFLGTAEAADTSQSQFVAVDRDARIYRAVPSDTRLLPIPSARPLGGSAQAPAAQVRSITSRFEAGEILGASHAAALEASAPPSALVDADHVVLHLSPTVGRFILLSAGPLSGKLPTIVRPELRLDLKLALDRVFEAQQPSITRMIDASLDGALRRVSIHVVPVPATEGLAPRAMVFFLDNGPGRPAEAAQNLSPPDEMQHLHSELKAAQEAELVGRIRHEAAAQELRASNEELQSLNEEYRSTAEELETSKEELQSINEELQTVNAELKSKLSIISAAHNDLQNLTASSEIGTLFLDTDLRIRMFTPPVAELINVTAADAGRPITDFTHRLDYDGIERDVRRVLTELAPSETEISSLDGRWFTMRVRPYRTLENQVEGAVVTFDDVTARRLAEATLRESMERLRQFGEASQDVLWIRDAETLQWEYLTPAFELIYGLDRASALRDDNMANWVDLILPEDRERAVSSIERVRDGEWVTFEYRIRRPTDDQVRWLRNTDFPIQDETGRVVRIGGVGHDITAMRQAEEALATAEQHRRSLLEGMPQLVWRSDKDGLWTWSSPQWQSYTGQSQEQSEGWGWIEAVHPDDQDATRRAWSEARPHGRLNVEHRVRRASDGVWRWHATRSVPLRAAAPAPSKAEGLILEWLGTTTDIDDLKRLQAQQEVMVAELQHRTRNLLAVVRNIARRSIPFSPGRDDYDARLAALSRVQSFLSRSPFYTVLLADVVEAELAATGDGASEKVAVGGPAVELPGEGVQAVALALHELVTNAVKYGAIAQPSGRLSITWRIETGGDGAERPHLVIDWRESGVAMPDGPPARRGYGSELITKALPYQLQAETLLEFADDGVWCRIMLPAGAFNESSMQQKIEDAQSESEKLP